MWQGQERWEASAVGHLQGRHALQESVGGEAHSPRHPPRPCAMVVPDFELICEIMLVAEGFLEARLLARKFITLYTLCKELLSKQVRAAGSRSSQTARGGLHTSQGHTGLCPHPPAPSRWPQSHPGPGSTRWPRGEAYSQPPAPTGSLRLGLASHQVRAGGGRLPEEGGPCPGRGPGAHEGAEGLQHPQDRDR